MVQTVATAVTGAVRRKIRRETPVVVSVTRRVCMYEQRASFYWHLLNHLIGAEKIPGVGTLLFSVSRVKSQ